MSNNLPVPQSDILIYQTEDRQTRIEVVLQNETVWLSLTQMAELIKSRADHMLPKGRSMKNSRLAAGNTRRPSEKPTM